MKTVKFRTILKGILFLTFAGIFLYVVFGSESESIEVSSPGAPPVPTETPAETEEEVEGDMVEEGEESPPIVEEPEQIEIDDSEDGPENREILIDEKQNEIDGHQYLVENNQLELYVKEENLSILIRNKSNGAVMYSTVDQTVGSNEEWANFTQSSVVMEYLVGTNIVTYRADMYTGNPEKSIEYTENGFEATIFYPELEISYVLKVSLTDEGIVAEIPQDQILEENDRFKVGGFYVYPFLGYSKLGERDGYMFIPDGSGALIHLKDNEGKYKQPYSKMVYGSNVGVDDPYVLSLFNRMNPFNEPEDILAPVFGMVQTDSEMGYLGIIEEGQYHAMVEAYPSGAILPYNWVTAKFIYRQVYNQPTSQDSGTMVVRQRMMNNFDIRVRYDFVSEDNATYFGLAENYRNYLLHNDMIAAKEEEFKARIDLFGVDVEDGLLFKNKVSMTTFGQANKIFNELQASGVDNILSIYKGWQNRGYYAGLPIRSFNPDSTLTDDYQLNELVEASNEQGIELFLYQDALRINLEESGNNRSSVMRKFNKRQHNENVYGNVYNTFHFLHPEATVDILKSVKDDYQSNQIHEVALGGITNQLFSYSERNKEHDRITTKQYYESIISEYADSFQLILDQPFSYLWGYTEKMVDVPSQSSGYVFTDEDIPFIALTLKGIVPMYSEYINFQANQDFFFLQLVEQGLNPSFYITYEDPASLKNTNSSHIYSSQFELYEEVITDYYEQLGAVFEQTKGALISNHEREGNLTKVTYDNGIIIYLNYSDEVQNYEGHTIEGLSYKVVHDE
ncbi:DUF5696 domain-containing protein [Alkalihalobacillus trypoxylicola]|uniref:Uncharacterized protein n=1 Tax=Alkalihalobacillus trypoxylicola TaxID=519424 RepID=A0A162ECQ2_9BACI|nr:DUF5696 domain-containing protein [Alkalihalobacillus trypoxylicola]KYG32293.1 hypothetical protein AZF04_05870 [Alkalihalobacillus trypoxylicola]